MFDLGRTFLAAVERSPAAEAVVEGQRRFTYADWYREISGVADGLSQQGLKSGDRVAVVSQNHLNMATLHWACQFLGIVVTPLNWRIKAEELGYCLEDSGARVLLYDTIAREEVGRSRPNRPNVPRIAIAAPEDKIRFAPWHGPLVTPHAKAEDLSLLLYTSGTTGRPKGVPRRHRAERAAALAHVAQTFTRAASARLVSCRFTTRWGCARCWRWRWSTVVSYACRA